ncbi:MAG: hypothetical protein IKC26_08340 [Clostridia bacterium]|nr:hypothetical protein [Clostridia bacterium]
MLFIKKKKTPNYGKIIAITTAAVAGACAVSYFVYKLVVKLKEQDAYEDDLCEGCPLADECDGECPIEELVEEEATEEATEEAAEAPVEQ